jgi:hypothetical protein
MADFTPLQAILAFFAVAGLIVVLVLVFRAGRDEQDRD